MKGFFQYRTVFWAIAVPATLFIASCKDKPDPDEKVYDRAALAANYADNLIVPGYDALILSLDSLELQADSLFQNLDSASLELTRARLKSSRMAWLKMSSYEFGPASTQSLRLSVNTFPSDINQINTNISAGFWDLATAANVDAKGFPALEYLLFQDSIPAVLANFGVAPDAATRRSYFRALVDELQLNLSTVRNGWNSYTVDFKALTGTDAGSATSFLVNQFTYDVEILKNARIGIPLGKTTMGTPVPGHVECLYGGYSVELAAAHARALKDVFVGRSVSGTDGFGLDDALTAVNAQYNGQPLGNAIKAQFDVVINKLNAIPEPLNQTVQTNAAVVDAAYVEIQRLVVMTKTDMASNLGILITYTDNDGD